MVNRTKPWTGLVLAVWAVSLQAAVVVPPAWDGLIGTTSETWRFTDNSVVTLPDEQSNPFADASATIATGFGSSGWQDPNIEFQVSGYDGAWDLGSGGTVDLTIPFADENTPLPVLVDVVLDLLYFHDISQVPTVSFDQTLSNLEQDLVDEYRDPDYYGWWRRLRISGSFFTSTAGNLGVTLTGDVDWGSVIDDITVYTQTVSQIPEPLVLTLLIPVFLVRLLRTRIFFRRGKGCRA